MIASSASTRHHYVINIRRMWWYLRTSRKSDRLKLANVHMIPLLITSFTRPKSIRDIRFPWWAPPLCYIWRFKLWRRGRWAIGLTFNALNNVTLGWHFPSRSGCERRQLWNGKKARAFESRQVATHGCGGVKFSVWMKGFGSRI